MTSQKNYEIIKDLALGIPPEQIARVEGASLSEVKRIQSISTGDILAEQEALRKAGRTA